MQSSYKSRQLVEALPLPSCTTNSRGFRQTATAPLFPLRLPFNGSPRQLVTSPPIPFISAIFWHPTSTRDRLPPSPHFHHFFDSSEPLPPSTLFPPLLGNSRQTASAKLIPLISGTLWQLSKDRDSHFLSPPPPLFGSSLKLPKGSLSPLIFALIWQLATAPPPPSSLLPFRSPQQPPTAPSPLLTPNTF